MFHYGTQNMRPKKPKPSTRSSGFTKDGIAAIAEIETQVAPGLTTNITSVTDALNVGVKAIKDIIVLRIDALVSSFI